MEITIIQQKIHHIRGQKIMLDFDLAELYEVPTKALNQAVKRNVERFPDDFMFQLTWEEYKSLRSQIVTLEHGGRGKFSKYAPFAFTEHGVAMLSSVIKSEKAIQVNIAIVRAFVAMRHYALTFADLAEKILSHDKALEDINEVLKYLGEQNQERADEISVLQANKPTLMGWEDRERIGFKKE